MAPHAEESVTVVDVPRPKKPTLSTAEESQATNLHGHQMVENGHMSSLADVYEPGKVIIERHDNYEYDHLRPSHPDVFSEPLQEQPYEEKGLKGDTRFRSLLEAANDIFDYNSKIGTEISGVKLTALTDQQKCDLARLVATRGVVFFRDQDDLDIDAQRKLAGFWGTVHRHGATPVPQNGLLDVHVVFTPDNSADQRTMFAPSFLWHADASFEIQPPSYTILKVLTGPPRGGGGDTLWASLYAAYDAMSKPMQKYLESLTVLHWADKQSESTQTAGNPIRRAAVTTEHPLVRVNPVTGWKSINFNPGFVKAICGVPKLESDTIIKYLTEVVTTTNEAICRFQWRKHDVAIWDNRTTVHTGTYGIGPHRRHGLRTGATGEKPYFDVNGKSQEEEYIRKWNLPSVNKDGTRSQVYND